MLFWRALLAFTLLPGLVGFAAPGAIVWFDADVPTFHPVGIIPFISGVCLLLWCVRDFYIAGKGTLAPWDPPRHLVEVGLYRISRNPMYIAVVLILVGWVTCFRVRTLVVYAIAVAAAFHLRVVLGEEPWLARTFGEEWQKYAARVPRWLI